MQNIEPIYINTNLPKHVSIIMDGNGRWAENKEITRKKGHIEGVKVAREIVNAAIDANISYLSLFAFSSENYRRPTSEVYSLMKIFISALNDHTDSLNETNIKMHFIGDRLKFSKVLRNGMKRAENITKDNTGLTLIIAMNYGGRWDILQAVKQISQKVNQNLMSYDAVTEEIINKHLSTSNFPDPDLIIRTGSVARISNFFLWQLAYSEIYFANKLWPDFSKNDFNKSLEYYSNCNRRFGLTQQQILEQNA